VKTSIVYRLFQIFVLAGWLGLMSGCASEATVEGMSNADLNRTTPNQAFLQSIEVQATTGGLETYPWWISRIPNGNFTQALVQSLQNHGYYISNPKNARYLLKATIQDVDYPWFGLDFDVMTMINYRLYEITTNRMIMDLNVKAVGIGTFGDAVFGAQRLRIANERSAKKSIGQLMRALQTQDPSQTIDPSQTAKP
jgi:hypothetical protein